MQRAFGERLRQALDLGALVADKRLGRKNGRGFFLYRDGKKAGVDPTAYRVLGLSSAPPPVDEEAVAERLAFAMLNEAARALEEGVVRQPRDGDIGALFGIGFPAFRGGPFRTMDTLGARSTVETLGRLAAAHGDRFLPAASLVEQAGHGGCFYPSNR
jgi:3-hydroxyacyl-CoA dehydrogenase/enoyl-CoA hydratase/3-hydroxybutyryl-CoA epimerase